MSSVGQRHLHEIMQGSVVSLTQSGEAADLAAVVETGPVVLVRYRPGTVGETARTVHVVALPTVARTGVLSALCDAVLISADLEAVALGEGMPCIACVLHCVTLTAEETSCSGPECADPAGPAPSGSTYQQWGWPVTQHRDQVRLHLDHTVSAVMIHATLGAEVIPVLVQRRCAPLVLAHPHLPDHHIVLTGEQYGLGLPWPDHVHQITGMLLLPPTPTPRGPITWVTTPRSDSLHLCPRNRPVHRTPHHIVQSTQPRTRLSAYNRRPCISPGLLVH